MMRFISLPFVADRKKRLDGKFAVSTVERIEVIETFEFEGRLFAVHHGRVSTDKFGVSDVISGLSVSHDRKNNTGIAETHLHPTKEEAVKRAMDNLRWFSKQPGKTLDAAVAHRKAEFLQHIPLMVQLKKFGLWKR